MHAVYIQAIKYFLKYCTIIIIGEPQSFTVQVTPNSEYPLDLYILMDLSYSMQDDLEMIRLLLGDLSKCMYLNYIPCHHYFQYTRSLHNIYIYIYKQVELPVDKVHEAQLSYKCDLYFIPCHHYFQYTRSLHNIYIIYKYQVELPVDKVHEVLIVQLSCKCDLYLGTVDVVHQKSTTSV